MTNWKTKGIPYCILLIAFVVAGTFTGWLVGVSRTPIANTLVPIGIGLLGAVSFSMFERKGLFDSFLKTIDDVEKAGAVSPGTALSLRGAFGGPGEVSFWSPAIWAIGAIVFCVSAYAGISSGIANRVPKYPSIDDLTKGVAVSEEDKAELHRFEFYCKSANVPSTSYEEAVKGILIPKLKATLTDPEVIAARPFVQRDKVAAPTEAERARIRSENLKKTIDDLTKTKWQLESQNIPVM